MKIKAKNMKLSVVIPAYNEENRLAKTLEDIDRYLRKQDYDYEIIVVNDGSKDRTAEVVKGMMGRVRNLRLIDNKVNKGKGGVVKQGLLEARGEVRLFTDADNSTSINHLERMWPEFEKGFDIVIGSRDVKGAVLDPPQPWYRRVLGDIFNLLVQVVVGLWGIWDTQCGFKALSSKVVEDIIPKCKIDRWAFDPEILILAKNKGYKIKEVPVHWVNDPHSKVKFKGMVMMLKDLLTIKWYLITKRYG
jgi:glycosyltransferase involved in cell wall biosynthesis